MKKIQFKIDLDGSQHWYLNGKRHRDDGLAVIYLDGSRYWYLDGEFILSKTTSNVRLEAHNG